MISFISLSVLLYMNNQLGVDFRFWVFREAQCFSECTLEGNYF